MLNDVATMNPKGNVKLELYNEREGVFFTKEKKNMVVLDANKIVAEMMADPSKTTRLQKIETGDTPITANASGTFSFKLSVFREADGVYDKDPGVTNSVKTFTLDGVTNITQLKAVKVGSTNLVINKDVFMKDAERGIIEFAVAPVEPINVTYRNVKNSLVDIIRGTEVVKLGADTWKRADAPKDIDKTYSIDYATGELRFENTKVGISVTYDYTMTYCLGFMSLGGKPAGHPDYKPVSFSNFDKIKTDMENEFVGSRMPILFPAEISTGKNEIDVLPTKPVAFTETTVQVTVADAAVLIYDIDNSGNKLLELVEVKDVTDPLNPVVLTLGTDVKIKDATQATIEFVKALAANNKFDVKYRVQKNADHLVYQLTQSPVVSLESVVHEDINGVKTVFAIQDRGLKLGLGDVWLMNPNAGIIQFSSTPTGNVPVQTPGQLTIQFKVNSGTVVKFVADFPKGIPGALKVDTTDTFIAQNGMTTFALKQAVMKDAANNFLVKSVKKNGVAATYTLSADGTQVTVASAVNNDTITVEYSYSKDTHEIYQVAMFDGVDKVLSKMFNISGIGPVTKDKNTGMRITWSVTF
jgi:hypothetical protein